MEKKRIVNVINFVRGVEPRQDTDLLLPVVEEIKLNKKYKFPNTFLLQYDAMLRKDIMDTLEENKDDLTEYGIWIEIVRPLCEKVGIHWRGRFDWDWHVNPGFLESYTESEKVLLLDELMRLFHEKFGYYPKSAGSWLIDSFSMNYLNEKYGMDAYAICREQWGTDGYTLWGGYYNGAFYPCKQNMLIPAQTKEEQITVPLFRMLGPDPTYLYYEQHARAKELNGCDVNLYTLEPVWYEGRTEKVVDWYYNNVFGPKSYGFAYAQIGQENSFGWPEIVQGLPMQMENMAKKWANGEVEIMTMGDAGRLYKDLYEMTPPSLESALEDWNGKGNQATWYCCKNYRLNLYCDGTDVMIRDFQLYRENQTDIYLSVPSTLSTAEYYALPIMDGYQFLGPDAEKAGIFFGKGKLLDTAEENGVCTVTLEADGRIFDVIMEETNVTVKAKDAKPFHMPFKRWGAGEIKTILDGDTFRGQAYGFEYTATVLSGKAENGCFGSENGTLTIKVIN